MKSKIMQRLLPAWAGFAAITIICSAMMVHGQDMIVNSFDTDQGGTFGLDWENFRSYAYGVTYSLDPTQDSTGNPNSGSMYITVNWPTNSDPNWNQNWNDIQFGFNTPPIYATNYINCEFDIKVDVANSHTAVDGTYGAIEVILNNPWTTVIGWAPLAATNGWQHISGSLAGITSGPNSEVVIGLVSTGGGSLTNTVSYWIDNIVLTAPVTTNSPVLSINRPPPPGLTCISSQPGGTWQRQVIGTVGGNYSWNTTQAASNTITYSMTITNFPGTAYSGYEGRFYLINGLAYGQVDANVDYNAANVVYLAVQENPDKSATASFYYKTNCPGNENFQSTQTNICATGPLGTWSLAFNNNTNVTLTAPNGTVNSFTIPAAIADDFQNPVYVYLGDRPNDNSRIGQSATFSQFSVTGAETNLSDNFSIFNTNTWLISAADPNGILLTTADTKCWVTWSLPDGGFSNLYATDNLTNRLANSQWLSLPTASTGWLNVGGANRMTTISQSMLNTVFTNSPAKCYFGLFHQ